MPADSKDASTADAAEEDHPIRIWRGFGALIRAGSVWVLTLHLTLDCDLACGNAEFARPMVAVPGLHGGNYCDVAVQKHSRDRALSRGQRCVCG